jgi:uncharacterized protein YggT (Ycf19 family)
MDRKTKRWILWLCRLVVLIIYLIVFAYAVILGIAFVLRLLGANPDADFADWIYTAAARILEPFRGIFPTTEITDRSVFDASLLFALLVYLFLGIVLHGIIDWLGRHIAGIDRAEEHDRMLAAYAAQERAAFGAIPPGGEQPVTAPPPTTPASGGMPWEQPPVGTVQSAPPPSEPPPSDQPPPAA